MSWYEDVYSKPEKYGLESLGDIEWRDESYEFDMTAVWKDLNGKLYWADDSGCSCPSPFEDFDSLDKLTTGSVADLQAHLSERLQGTQKTEWNDPEARVADILFKVIR